MNENTQNNTPPGTEDNDASAQAGQGSHDPGQSRNGPQFTPGPDPLAGVKKSAADAFSSMEGKTVSMRLYVGTIVGVIVLMLLARCGG